MKNYITVVCFALKSSLVCLLNPATFQYLLCRTQLGHNWPFNKHKMDRYIDFNPALAKASCRICEEHPPPPYQSHRKPTEATTPPSYHQATQHLTDVPNEQSRSQRAKKRNDGLLARCWKRLAPPESVASKRADPLRYVMVTSM